MITHWWIEWEGQIISMSNSCMLRYAMTLGICIEMSFVVFLYGNNFHRGLTSKCLLHTFPFLGESQTRRTDQCSRVEAGLGSKTRRQRLPDPSTDEKRQSAKFTSINQKYYTLRVTPLKNCMTTGQKKKTGTLTDSSLLVWSLQSNLLVFPEFCCFCHSYFS